jgi:cysteine desulfurase
LNGHATDRISNNLNITFHGVKSDQLMNELHEIAVSAGAACLNEETDTHYSHVLKAIGLSQEDAASTLRFGVGRFTTEEEIKIVGSKITEAVARLRKYSEMGVQ